MKLLLTSSGLGNKVLKDKFLELVGKPVGEIKSLYIPTAANVEENTDYVDRDKGYIFDIGITRENFVEYDLDEDVSGIGLDDVDVVYVEGGNTFYLLDRIRKTGFEEKIRELIEDGAVYVGVSAGSILAGPDIGIALPADTNDVGLTDFSGLGFTDKVICPHYNRKEEDIAAKFEGENDYSVVRLNDGQALLVDGDGVGVVG